MFCFSTFSTCGKYIRQKFSTTFFSHAVVVVVVAIVLFSNGIQTFCLFLRCSSNEMRQRRQSTTTGSQNTHTVVAEHFILFKYIFDYDVNGIPSSRFNIVYTQSETRAVVPLSLFSSVSFASSVSEGVGNVDFHLK